MYFIHKYEVKFEKRKYKKIGEGEKLHDILTF